MEHTIGELAGEVYDFLEEAGEASLSQISREVEGPQSKVNMAVGWLAREGNLEFVDLGRGTGVRLK
ncbi:MAG: winged helix-turn-helix domain-containing protein [Candidatus Nanohaloarchaea archaeon]